MKTAKTTVLCTFLATGILFDASAQTKLDAGSRARLRAAETAMTFGKTADGRLKTAPAAKAATIRAFVTLENGDTSELEAAGATVQSIRGNIALAEFPKESLAAIEALASVKSIRTEKPLNAKLNIAREVSGIDKIHSGIGLPQAYTGKGVLAGIYDGGFDPNHVNFKNADGSSRIENFTYFRQTQSGEYVQETYGADYIPKIDTESSETYHGTHTLGIMAGGYKGKVRTVVMEENDKGSIMELDNPYYGVATDADIAVGCGPQSDYFIAAGCDQILNYAYYKQQPAVINLSLGSNVGPHDGSSILCQFIDMASELDPVVFCVSAGNEGDLNIAMHKTFTEEDSKLASFIKPEVQAGDYINPRYGQIYIYSNDDTPFTVQAIEYNTRRKKVSQRFALEPISKEDVTAGQYWISDEQFRYSETDVVNQLFSQHFNGYVGVFAEYDQFTERYTGVIDFFTFDAAMNANTYLLGFEVTGANGQRVDVFCDGVFNSLSAMGYEDNGFANGTTDGTISDVACGQHPVVVGAYNTRDEYAALGGYIFGFNEPMPYGKASSYSSWGTLYDGRQLPTVCAPGTAIISSSNEYYLDDNNGTDNDRQADCNADGRRYSWHQSTGTSMSTPLVAGSVALWLEADPTLRAEDVKDIIRATAVVDEDVSTHSHPVQWGAGKFDAYAGLKEVLARAAGLNNVAVEPAKPLITLEGNRCVKVCTPGADIKSAKIFGLQGTLLKNAIVNGSEATLECSDLAAGIYILNINDNYSQKITVK